MKNINERIEKIIKDSGLSNSEFADTIEVPRSSISHILSGRNKPSLDFLMKIKSEFPKYNWDWLILGEGEINFENKIEHPTPQESIKPKAATLPDLFSLIDDDQFGVTESEDKISNSNPDVFPIPIQNKKETIINDSQRLENNETISKSQDIDNQYFKVKKIVFFYENGKFEIFEP
jgi:plasmid maintenance system antidote protein VapI